MILQVGKPRQAHITQNVVYVKGAFTHFKPPRMEIKKQNKLGMWNASGFCREPVSSEIKLFPFD